MDSIYADLTNVRLGCDSPQYLLDGGVTECGLCMSCCRRKENAERQRRFYWLKRKRGTAHV